MPLYRHTKLPPPPELGEKTIWQYLPRHTGRRVIFLLLALGAVMFLKRSGGWSFGGLLDGPRAPAGADTTPTYHIRVTSPGEAPQGASAP
ncbi:MAG TPA: hypothetical protein VK989_12155 [Polyangia bacterium]|jgi:hypothetical protein|nr:hypothetical protein [Polyangia bacterium]